MRPALGASPSAPTSVAARLNLINRPIGHLHFVSRRPQRSTDRIESAMPALARPGDGGSCAEDGLLPAVESAQANDNAPMQGAAGQVKASPSALSMPYPVHGATCHQYASHTESGVTSLISCHRLSHAPAPRVVLPGVAAIIDCRYPRTVFIR